MSKAKKILLWIGLSCVFLYIIASVVAYMAIAGPPDWVLRRMGGRYLMYLHNPGPGDPKEFDANGNPVYKK